MSYTDEFTPTGLEKVDDDLIGFSWADGATTRIAVDYLRSKCPCADCVDEWTHVVKVKYDDVKGTGFKNIRQMGTYAFHILFADGHDTGIFTYKKLRQLSEAWSAEHPEAAKGDSSAAE